MAVIVYGVLFFMVVSVIMYRCYQDAKQNH